MATLDKLLIYGIRSFAPNDTDVQKITFTSPLNLFLGHNGCGKTTIIESLKFACTGELPSGSQSGQGFVNDPKMSSQSSTKGQIRLSVIDSKGNKYTIVKTIQVTQTPKGELKFKRLESVMKLEKANGVESAASSRCVEIDSNFVQIMGLSSPILNNVIFCHQDNSLWPLDEGKKLKEKFDEIFDAVKYNKCIENMRKILKNKQDSIKTLLVELKYKESIKNAVENERAKLQEKERKLNLIIASIDNNKEQLKPVLSRLQEICTLEENLSKLQSSLAVKENEHKLLENQKNDILKNIKFEYQGSDEDLKTEINNSAKSCESIKKDITDLEKKREDIKETENELNSKIGKIQCDIGLLEEEKKQFENTCANRNQLITELKDELSLPYSYNFEESNDVVRAISHINIALSDSESSLRALLKKHELNENDLQVKIDTIRIKVAEKKQSIKSTVERSIEYKKKVRNIESQLRELNVSDEQLKSICDKINNIDGDLNKLKDSLDQDALNKSIDEDRRCIRELEDELEVLESEYKILQQNSINQAELEKTKHDIRMRESEIYKLKNKNFDNFSYLFSDVIPEKDFKLSVEKQQQLCAGKVSSTTDKINSKEKVCTTIQTKLKLKKEELKAAVNELNSNQEKIRTVCKNMDFNDILKETYNKIEKLQKDKGQYSSGKIIFERYIEDFEKNNPCPVCQTKLNSRNAVNDIIKNLRDKIEGIPNELKRVENDLKHQQDQYSKLLQLKPLNQSQETLASQKIPKLENEVEVLQVSYDRNAEELRTLQDDLKEPQKKVDVCNKLITDATLIDQYNLDIRKYRDSIGMLEMQLKTVPSNRSRQDTETLIENKKLDLKNLQQKYNNNQKRLEKHNKRYQDLRENRSKLVEQQLNIQKAMQGKPQLEEQLTEYKQSIEKLDVEKKEAELQVIPLENELKEAIEIKEITRKRNQEIYRDAQTKYNHHVKLRDEINNQQQKIKSFISRNISMKIARFAEDLESKSREKEGLAETGSKVVEGISEKQTQLANWDGTIRNLKDNLELREKQQQQNSLKREVDKLQKQIGKSDLMSLVDEKRRLLEKHEKLNKEINGFSGQKSELEIDINEKKADLEKPENKDAFRNYKHKHFELKVTEKSCRDMKIYMLALERSLIHFHSERMKLINKRVRELWRSIYRGNDIDYISVKTEQPKTEIGKKRVYSYKVMQVKRGVELEMRGRCSAGQKVLACLIIRMALAETFSKNCGILALDEPTTNLDRENIISLSQSLARIVRKRSEEKNFQLLVITHDEEFLEALKTVEGISHYWKVSRNNEGFSKITKERL